MLEDLARSIPTRLVLSVEQLDPDYVLVHVAAADGAFAGATSVYAPPNAFRALAAELRGFPARTADTRELILGSFDPEHAGGAVRLIFRTTDGAGHSALEAEIEDKHWGMPLRRVSVRFPIEAAAVDRFVHALAELPMLPGQCVMLRGAV